MPILEGLQQMMPDLTQWRRALHSMPEPGYNEVKTSEYICRTLDIYNISYEKNIAGTGIVAWLGKSTSDKTIAFRADMDALSLEEQTGVDFKSKHKGYMHGCGHDGHMTMLIGLAVYLSKNQEDLKQKVVFIFQPAEEGPGGAKAMIDHGIIKKHEIDEFFGIHLHPEFEEGQVAISSGPVMAMTGEFDITIKSISGHGAMPHTANDAIIIGGHLISQFQSIISRNINPTQAGVLTIGKIYGGERRNIIADRLTLEGTIRAFSEENFYKIQERMGQICMGVEKSFDCKIECDQRTMYPPVVNHSSSVEFFRSANQSLEVVDFPPQMISEDFSYFLKEKPGAFIFLGTRNKEKNFVYPLHNSKFNFDEKVLMFGIQSYINLLNGYGSSLK